MYAKRCVHLTEKRSIAMTTWVNALSKFFWVSKNIKIELIVLLLLFTIRSRKEDFKADIVRLIENKSLSNNVLMKSIHYNLKTDVNNISEIRNLISLL